MLEIRVGNDVLLLVIGVSIPLSEIECVTALNRLCMSRSDVIIRSPDHGDNFWGEYNFANRNDVFSKFYFLVESAKIVLTLFSAFAMHSTWTKNITKFYSSL